MDQILSLSAQTADKLLSAGEGDASLYYLALLRYNDPEAARKSLRWNRERSNAAWQRLSEMGLFSVPSPPPETAAPENTDVPDYTQSDLIQALDSESTFNGLYQLTEQRLGKKLSGSDLKSLYEIYDYLAMPAEVILLLLTWCIQEAQEKYGSGRAPRMSEIKRTAYKWQRLGLDTIEAAEDYLRSQNDLRARERTLLPLLNIKNRPPLDREREYIDSWIQMGFPDDAIRLAYERTVMKKQDLNWPYMNSILKSWYGKGLLTVADIEAKDRPSKSRQVSTVTPEENEERLKKDLAWLEQFSKDHPSP
ncbi:MAG: DnaD domain protein [Oscillospiraceae bacterium]|nr:DnaD domain protein [Oscillospiraceae bacterium]